MAPRLNLLDDVSTSDMIPENKIGRKIRGAELCFRKAFHCFLCNYFVNLEAKVDNKFSFPNTLVVLTQPRALIECSKKPAFES